MESYSIHVVVYFIIFLLFSYILTLYFRSKISHKAATCLINLETDSINEYKDIICLKGIVSRGSDKYVDELRARMSGKDDHFSLFLLNKFQKIFYRVFKERIFIGTDNNEKMNVILLSGLLFEEFFTLYFHMFLHDNLNENIETYKLYDYVSVDVDGKRVSKYLLTEEGRMYFLMYYAVEKNILRNKRLMRLRQFTNMDFIKEVLEADDLNRKLTAKQSL